MKNEILNELTFPVSSGRAPAPPTAQAVPAPRSVFTAPPPVIGVAPPMKLTQDVVIPPDGSVEVAADAGSNAVAPVTVAEAAAMPLTPQQRTAITMLTSGSTRADAAVAAGVNRVTLYRWMNHDPVFQCAYNAWQRDVITTAQCQLLAGTRDAVAAVLNAIRKGDARIAWKLLEGQGLSSPTKYGPTDVHELQRREQYERQKREIAERKERNDIAIDDMMTPDEI